MQYLAVFTGIVEGTGKVKKTKTRRVVHCNTCSFEMIDETAKNTSLGLLKTGDLLNIERSVKACEQAWITGVKRSYLPFPSPHAFQRC